MNYLSPLLLTLISLLYLFGALIAYQDFKQRLINLWIILVFAALNISQYLAHNSVYQLMENLIFNLLYFLFISGTIVLYYFLKNRKFEKILDTKIGWGDILIFLAIGPALEIVELIYFFSSAFILSLIFSLIFIKKDKSIPLAAFVVIFYLAYIPAKIYFY